jgi:RNA polymerase sigma factor (TIGR02999 family)
MNDVTQILSAIEHGDARASEQLLPLVYRELRRLAKQRLAREGPGQTLQATALVHEAYLRLVEGDEAQRWNSRGHFFAAAAEAMRRILVESARRKRAEKRGGRLERQDLDDVDIAAPAPSDDLLVSLADYLVRWSGLREDPKSTERSLDLLRRAESFHPPTRAFYFVRSECHRRRGDTAAADEDVARFRTAKAQSAWDYFLPSHTAGWRGDLDEAVRSYQAALTLQPNHYNSLFFLAMRLATDKINRPAEAIAYFTGCIALRPDHIVAYTNRGELQQKLGRTEAAEADYTAAIAAASNDKDRAAAYAERSRFFEGLGRAKEARSDNTRIIELLERTWAGRRTMPGVSDVETNQVMNVLAVAYLDVGRYQDAIPLLEQGLEARKARFGPDDPESLKAMHNLGAAYSQAGRSRDAIPLLETTLKSWESKPGPDHADTLECRANLANAYHQAGRTAEAMRLHEANLRLIESKNGPDHADTLKARNSLAEDLRTAEAIRLNESNLKLRESRLGPDHPDTLTTRNNLAMDYRAAGRTAEAIPLFEANLKLHESKLGPDHPQTLISRNNLARAYNAAGRTAEAIALGESTLKLQELKLGPDHPDTIETRSGLAYAYYTVGRTAEAIPMFEAVLRQRESKLGPDHPHTLASRGNLAGIYNAAGRTAEAISLHEATLKRNESKLGSDHPATLTSRHNLAVAYDTAGRTTEAIALFEKTLTGRERKLGPDHPNTLDTVRGLAHALESQRPADAERLFLRAAEGHRRLQGGSPVLDGTLAEFGLHLLKRGKWAEAEPPLRECLAIREKAIPDDWRKFNSMSLLGGALLGQGRFAEAELLVVEGYEGMIARKAKIPPQGEVRLSEAGTRVVQLYEVWGKPEKAADWRKRLVPMLPDLPDDVFARPSPR